MSLEAIELCVSFPDIEHFEFVVSTPRQEPVAIDRVPPDHIHLIVVRLNLIDSLARHAWVKHLDIVVFSTCENQTLCGMPIAGSHLTFVPLEHILRLGIGKVENPSRVVIGTGDKLEGALREREISYTVLVTLYLILLLHLGV